MEPENDGYSYGFGKFFPQGTVDIFLTEGFFQRETVCQVIRKGGDFRCTAMFRKAIHGCSPIPRGVICVIKSFLRVLEQ